MEISPAQVRAARALLNLSQAELAKRAGVSQRSISGYEAETSQLMRANLAAVRQALEQAGITFTNGDEPGVRMKAAG